MTTTEYHHPEWPRPKQPSESGRVSGVGSFGRNWLMHQDTRALSAWGITAKDIPDPVLRKPPLSDIKIEAKEEAMRLALGALVKATVDKAERDIDAAVDEAAVKAVLDAI